MGTINASTRLNEGTTRLLNHIGTNVKRFGENYASVVNQQEVADALDVNVRTVYRQLKKLEEDEIIDLETKRGRDGGTVVMFNKDVVKFKSHVDNPFTGTTKTAKEIKELYFPDKGTYVPDTRTPEEKARDEIQAKRRQTEDGIMNNDLRRKSYPDDDFFKLSENPEEVFKTYILSRAYNATLVSRIEAWKNEAEKNGDEVSFDLAKRASVKYYNYDVLPHQFMGTMVFEHFKKLHNLLQDRGYDMMDYLNNAFDTFIFLLRQGKRVNPPYVNTLHGGKTLERFIEQKQWKRDFDKKHPYYARPGQVNSKVTPFPINHVISMTYKQPMGSHQGYNEHILNSVQVQGGIKGITKENYYKDVVSQIKESDLEDIVKKDTINFFEEKIVKDMMTDISPTAYLQTNLRKLVHGDDVPEGIEPNTREWYAARGNFHAETGVTPLTIRQQIRRGYYVDFSLTGSGTFEKALRTIEDASGINWSYKNVQVGLDKFENLIPLTQLGEVDLDLVLRETLTDKQLEMDKTFTEMFAKMKVEEDKAQLQKMVDNSPQLWYNVLEDVVGHSLRDGQSVTGETLRGE